MNGIGTTLREGAATLGVDLDERAIDRLLRLLDMGIRSVIVTLYFSGKTAPGFTGKSPLQLTGYETTALMP